MPASYKYLITTGVVVADTSSVLQDVQGEWTAAFGSSLNLDASTPQGTMIAAEVLSRTQVMKNNAELANQINPNQAYGTFLDSICSLLGVTRGQNTSTTGTGVTITGNSGTFIPSGSHVKTLAGDVFLTVGDNTIPTSGSLTNAVIASQAYGTIPLPVGTLTIIDGIVGWGSISVTAATTVVNGTTSINDPQLKNVRNQRLAAQGVGSSAAIRAAVLAVNNVTSCQVVENNTGATGAVNGVTFSKANAMWVCVAGTPAQADVANALYVAHQGGCPWDYGTNSGVPVGSPTGVQITDATTGQKYWVMWTTPVMFDVYAHVTVKQGNSTADPTTTIKNAIIAYATGQLDGEPGFQVGVSISAYELSVAIGRAIPGLFIKECSIATVAAGGAAPVYPTGYSQEVELTPFQQGQIASGNILVVVQ